MLWFWYLHVMIVWHIMLYVMLWFCYFYSIYFLLLYYMFPLACVMIVLCSTVLEIDWSYAELQPLLQLYS